MFGGKNSFWNKPLGTGKKSVNNAVTNLIGEDAKNATDFLASSFTGGGAIGNLKPRIDSGKKLVKGVLGKEDEKPTSTAPAGSLEAFMEKGREKGEEVAGGTAKEMGEGRADIRDRLNQILSGESAGASALKQDQQQQQKSLKAQQAMAGGGGQMNVGQQQALKRQADIDYAKFTSAEKRQALADLSKEYRGAAGDITRSTGQYGSVMVGGQPAAQPQSQTGIISDIFGGLI